jgi:hypothetical protein
VGSGFFRGKRLRRQELDPVRMGLESAALFTPRLAMMERNWEWAQGQVSQGGCGKRYIGMAATLIAILVVAIIFAMTHHGGSGTAEGARLGVLIGIFVVCAFVLHNYVNLNIGLKLALGQAVVYFIQWTIIGIVIGLIYKPFATP